MSSVKERSSMNDDNPYAAPEFSVRPAGKFADPAFGSFDAEGCWQDGNLLVLSKGAQLPDRCIKCNLPANDFRLERKLSWHPPIWFVTVFISPLIYVIVALCVRHTAKIEVGLCEEHRRRRSRAIASAWIAILGGFGLIFGGVALVDPEWVPIPVLVGLVTILVGIFIGILGSQVATTKSIDEHHVWLAKANPEYLKMLPTWLD